MTKKKKKLKVLKSAYFTYTLTQIPLQNGVEKQAYPLQNPPHTPFSTRNGGCDKLNLKVFFGEAHGHGEEEQHLIEGLFDHFLSVYWFSMGTPSAVRPSAETVRVRL